MTVGQSGDSVSPLQAMIREQLARKGAQHAAALKAVVDQCDPHWEEVVRWAIEEYGRQLQAERERD